jgi:hypothetical protein
MKNIFKENRLIWGHGSPKKMPESASEERQEEAEPSSSPEGHQNETVHKGNQFIEAGKIIEGMVVKAPYALTEKDVIQRGLNPKDIKEVNSKQTNAFKRYFQLTLYLKDKPRLLTMQYNGINMRFKASKKNGVCTIESGNWKAQITESGMKMVYGTMPKNFQDALDFHYIYNFRDGKILSKYRAMKGRITSSLPG